MPSLTFVLPHWLYWLGLLAFPLLVMLLLYKQRQHQAHRGVSLPTGYFLWLTAGFVGMHRLYFRNRWGLLYIPLFLAVIFINSQIHEHRTEQSKANNTIKKSEFLLQLAEKKATDGDDSALAKIPKLESELAQAQIQQSAATATTQRLDTTVKGLGILIILALLIDAILLPRLKRRCDEKDEANPLRHSLVEVDDAYVTGGEEHSVPLPNNPFERLIHRVNLSAGNFVAYWSVIAVIVYYYEVVARYVFNSPTNWAHEGMFLMFGMQYLLAGGFCLREKGHVRVDVVYAALQPATRALLDIITSVFFFIFVVCLLVTGWIFFNDSYSVSEVSFTEWGIQYWPVKFALPLGAILLMLQGISQLCEDIRTYRELRHGS